MPERARPRFGDWRAPRRQLAGERFELFRGEHLAARFAGERLFQVSDHLFARRVTRLDYVREVPLTITARLLFYKSGRLSTLKFSKPGWLDSQTLRGIREMPQETAEKLDKLLPPMLLVKN